MEEHKIQTKEKENIHKGHRQRLKDKVRKNGLSSLSVHEVLELLLTYTIPQKDTNKLSHNLISEFGGIANVLDAGYLELKKAKGVGDETALFLSFLPSLFEIYKANKSDLPTLPVNTTERCVNYFRNNFEIRSNEYLYIVCLNRLSKVIKTIIIEGVNDNKIKIDIRDLTEKINSVNTYAVIMFHTHPHGECKPSVADLDATQNIMYVCGLLNILFCDHIILNEDKYLSLANAGYLDKMFDNVRIAFPNISHKHIRFQQTPQFKLEDNSPQTHSNSNQNKKLIDKQSGSSKLSKSQDSFTEEKFIKEDVKEDINNSNINQTETQPKEDILARIEQFLNTSAGSKFLKAKKNCKQLGKEN